jgi:uncharacterized repeat protein (TIGR01451 family)
MRYARLCRGSFPISAALALVAAGAALAATKPTLPAANFDARLQPSAALQRAVGQRGLTRSSLAAELATRTRGRAALVSQVPGATARFSPITAGPELVAAGSRPLTGPAPGRTGLAIVRDFLDQHRDLYGLTAAEVDGLELIGESRSPRSGIRMVRVVQKVGGLPVFGSETRFILDRDGRVWRSLGQLVPGLGRTLAGASLAPQRTAAETLSTALAGVGINVDKARISSESRPDGRQSLRIAGESAVAGEVVSELLLFPLRPGVVVPAWRHLVFTAGDADWNVIVAADSGLPLWRKNMREDASTQEARFSVYVQADGQTPADSPAPQSPSSVAHGSGTQFPEIARTVVNMSVVQDLTASPNGWIDDGGTTTTGNNVDACVDRVSGGGETNVCDIGTIDNNGRPVGNPDGNGNNRDFLGTTPRDFSYAPAPSGGNPNAGDTPTGIGTTQVNFRRGATTQLFYVTNWYHDQLFQLGFDEPAGNFQQANFQGLGGFAGDRVLADVQDGSGTNNANFATPPDGQSGRMQMFRFTGPNPDRDGDLDAEIVIHELTHGLSNRLVGNADGLVWSVGRGLGEGWSDFYALALLNGTNADDPDGQYSTGAYATYQLGGLTDNYLYGIRRFPFSTDNSINPLTWADVDDVTADMTGGSIPVSPLGFEFNGGLEVHNSGEIWTLSLWEMRSRIIADPAGANGDVPTGNQTALQLVTDALKMTPANPSFVDARDALIAADCAANACANERWIWEAFADRGLGWGAVAPLGQMGFGNLGHMAIGESFALPKLDFAAVAVDDSLGNNNGAIEAGEPIGLTVTIENPWLGTAVAAGGTATLTSSTPGVMVLDGSATLPAIAAGATGAGDGFQIIVPLALACGDALDFTVTTTTSLGTTAFDFRLRLGTPSGTGPLVTYTSSPALAIPDGDPVGAFATQVITDDYEIADLDFRVDSLTHTFTGDLTVMLRGPNGYGGDLIWLREILFGGGDGDNFVNTVIDDESANDLNQTFATDAPFTGDWQPAFNSALWLLFGDPAVFPDPVGQLSRYDGSSTAGTWTVHVADQFPPDTGTLNSWSLLVTPRAFTCAAFTPTAAVAGTKTVSGTFQVGGTVTYTVTLTNTGALAQADNPGDELTDVLPSSLTLVSAGASAGTASANVGTNTVTWNGGLAPLNGTVTITITATINAGTDGTFIDNQASISFDSNGDGSNDTSGQSDDPGTAAILDPTRFAVATAAQITATKEVSPLAAQAGDAVTYTVVLVNSGSGAQGDNPGDELVDVLPAGLSLTGASATSGVATANLGTNTVTWNGSIPVAGMVTITIEATVDAGATGTLNNQATFNFDGNGDGTNEANGQSDDPATATSGDATALLIGLSVLEIPTVSEWGLALLFLVLGLAGLQQVRRRRTA